MSSTLEIRAILRDEFSAAVEKMKAEILSLGTTATTAGAAMRQGMSSVLPTMESVNESLGRNVAQLRAQAAAYKSAEGQEYLASQKALRAEIDQLTQSGENNGMTWQTIASKYYLVSQAASFASNVIGSLVESASKYEMIRERLNAAEKSEDLGGKDFKDIRELAKKPGLGFEQAASTMATLRGMKVTAIEAKSLINGIAAANASAAGTAEQFGGVMYQVQQSISLGRLMAEDLRPIMQSIPTLGAAIQESFGSSSAEQLNKRLKESGMSVRDFWLKVSELGQNLPATGETISNNLDNMSDAWTRFKASLTNTDVIKSATGALAQMIEAMAMATEGDKAGLGKMGIANWGKEIEQIEAKISKERENPYADKGKIKDLIRELDNAKQSYSMAISQSMIGGGTSVQGYHGEGIGSTAPRGKTQQQIEEEEKAAKKYAEAVKKNAEMIEDVEIDAFNKAEQDRANRNQTLRMKLGSSDGLIKSEAYMKEDKKQDDDYWKDREKAEADYKKQFNANQKVIFAAYKLDEEKKTKITEDEWKARSDMARSYADTLAGTMASAYTDIWVNGRDTFSALYDAFSEMITKMAIEMAAKATIFGALSLIPGMGGATGLLGGAGSFIFGARASGGAVFPGMTYRKNEDAYGGGGEPFRPSTAGTIMPNRSSTGTGSDGAVHYHFAAGTSRADAGYIVRAIQQGTRERRRTVSRGL
jgi:tape measure domain-containing protein